MVGHDIVHAAQEPLGVVAPQHRHTADEDDLAPVWSDVGLVKADPVALGRLFCRLDERMQAGCDALGACALGEGVDAGELEERDGRLPVLGLFAATEQVDPGVGREEPGDVEVADGRWGRRWDRVGLGGFRRAARRRPCARRGRVRPAAEPFRD